MGDWMTCSCNKEKYVLMSIYGRKTVMEHFMLSNILKAKMLICIDKMYKNKIIKNSHMQKIVRFKKCIAISGSFTLLKKCNFQYVDNSSFDRDFLGPGTFQAVLQLYEVAGPAGLYLIKLKVDNDYQLFQEKFCYVILPIVRFQYLGLFVNNGHFFLLSTRVTNSNDAL